MQPKIFISHSAKDEFTSSLLAAIEEQLSAAGYYVLVDRTRLKIEGVGSNWRATLNQWLDICDGAILLISPDAVKSLWVHAESTILNYRHHRDKQRGVEFPLFIVHTGGTQPNQIAGPEFGINALDHIQSAEAKSGVDIFAIAFRMFAPLLEAAKRSESSDLCFDISKELGVCNEESLVRASERIEKDFTRLRSHAINKPNALAYLFMGAQLREVAHALCEIWPTRRPAQDNIIRLLEPTWADPRSVGWLIEEFVKIEPPRTAVVPTAHVDSVACHIDRAQRRNPGMRWVRTVVPKLGDREPQDCIEKLSADLAYKLRIGSSEDVLAEIRSTIEMSAEQGYPFVFIFGSWDAYERVGHAIEEVFGPITNIVLDKARTSAISIGGRITEIPNVDPGREDAFWRDRKLAWAILASLPA
jgi:hypothetical protein